MLKQKFILHQNIVRISLKSCVLSCILRIFKVIHSFIVALVLHKLFLSSLDLLTLDILPVAHLIIHRVILRNLLWSRSLSCSLHTILISHFFLSVSLKVTSSLIHLLFSSSSQVCADWMHMIASALIASHLFIIVIVMLLLILTFMSLSVGVRGYACNNFLFFSIINGLFIKWTQFRYLSLNVHTAWRLLKHHFTFILILKMLDGALFDVSDTKGSSLIDIHSGRILIVALTLIVIINYHLRFFLRLILLLFFILFLTWLIFKRLLLIRRHFIVVLTYNVQRLSFFFLLARIIVFICFCNRTGSYTWNQLIIWSLMLCIGRWAGTWIMRNRWILLLLLLKLLLISFNFAQIQLVHDRLFLGLLLLGFLIFYLVFFSFKKIYLLFLSWFPALLRVEILSRWINIIFSVIRNGINRVMIKHWACVCVDKGWVCLDEAGLDIVIGRCLSHPQDRGWVFPEESAAVWPHNLLLCHLGMIDSGLFSWQWMMLNLHQGGLMIRPHNDHWRLVLWSRRVHLDVVSVW